MRKGAIIALLAVAALLAALAWMWRDARQKELQLGLDSSRVISEVFAKANALKVATLSGKVLASSEDPGFLGLVRSSQRTSLPYSADYFVDLSRLDSGDYRWDAESRTLIVEIPDVTVAPPNINEARATTEQGGLFISRGAAQRLARQVSRRASGRAAQAARKTENMARARENARDAVSRISRAPLVAAGLEDVSIVVRYPWEPRGSARGEQMDRSRPISEVIRDAGGGS